MILLARVVLLAACVTWTGISLAAQQPDVANAKLETRSAPAGLEKEFRAVVEKNAGPVWIGYAVPLVPGDHHMCCYDCEPGGNRSGSALRGCRLEGENSFNMQSGKPGRVELEGPRLMWVLFRVAPSRVLKVRVFSDDCPLDAGGLPLYWLTAVHAAESVEFLSGFVRGMQESSDDDSTNSASDFRFSNFDFPASVGKQAMAAIALTDDPAADRAFDRFVAADSPTSIRASAAFWLGAARGAHGLELLKRMVREDASERVREGAVFGLSISKQPGSLQALIDVAHQGSTRVRGQAIFWLAQKAGSKAASAITAAIENDPETEVKKRAVFALSQLPADEGVPLLIRVARTNRNPEVRRQAIFWLGQSKDPRAWAFIEDVLTH